MLTLENYYKFITHILTRLYVCTLNLKLHPSKDTRVPKYEI